MGRRLDQDTKNEIIRLIYEEGISTRSLAHQMKIGRTTIQAVLRDYRTANGLKIRSNKGLPQKNKNVEKDLLVKELEMQVAVLRSFLKELERWDTPK
ncbi:MAG: hypothetical protein SCK57_11275 [Bacillota bacterium]|nr:hypothetical protein [Bacillota bacterium]MDW7678232.1 hypothetical protein [Bacillota bacterium]